MNKAGVALVLEEIGTLLELQGENQFRARAFHSAARALDKLQDDLDALARRGELERIPGVGPATAAIIRELLQTGASALHKRLQETTPRGFYEMLGVPGLGPRKIQLLHEHLGINTIDALEEAARAGRLAEVPGFGEKTQEKILSGVGFVRGTLGRRRQHEVLHLADRLVEFLSAQDDVIEASAAGEVRRCMETVDGIDLVAATTAPDLVLSAFLALPGTFGASRDGNRAVVRLSDGMQLRLHAVPPEQLGAALIEETGGAKHVTQLRARAHALGLALNPEGLCSGGARMAESESDIYAALGLAFIPPELRENQGEIAAAESGALPQLVEFADIRGCFHNHTVASDGTATVAEMAEAAQALGWRYLGIADHSQFASYAGGLSPDEILRQHDEIDAWNDARGAELYVLKGIEADILPDGRLDYWDRPDILERFDFIVGSVHSGFRIGEKEMTQRVLRVLENPHLSILAHPTGRLLLRRAEYAIDVDAVLEAAAEQHVAVEINADPYRMDLDWRYWKRARELGVRCAINPDAHSARALQNVRFGVHMARKGWLSPDDVINTWSLEAVRRHFRSRGS